MNGPSRYDMDVPPGWPAPDAAAVELSRKLTGVIHRTVEAENGRIGFDRFMGMALYEPGLGYYSGGARKFGPDGDFTTAPETSPLFSACIARQCEQVFELTGSSTILELGAGTGIMASDVISDLGRRSSLPEEYLILETSADLRDRQRRRLERDHPQFIDRIRWLEALPGSRISGVILANEVLDAMPVNRLRLKDNRLFEMKVMSEGGRFDWLAERADDDLENAVTKRLGEAGAGLPDGYVTEFSSILPAFLRSLSESIASGVILFMDYGYPRHEYYHPQRIQGTLICHYRHRSHDNPFILIGIQDISAFVDFTAVAEYGHGFGLDVKGYSPQAAFLVSLGLENVLREYSDGDNELLLSQQAGQLLLPGQMGEKFKVMALSRGIDPELNGFRTGNSIHRL